MPKIRKNNMRVIASAFILVGIIIIILSSIYVSSFFAIFGLAICFWGGIFLYITPVKHVPVFILNASLKSQMTNTERLLNEWAVDSKAIYLPPKNLQNANQTLVLIPAVKDQILSDSEEITKKIFLSNNNGMLLTPPGDFIVQVLQQQLNTSFAKLDLSNLTPVLLRLLVDNLGLCENIELERKNDRIIVEVAGYAFNELCKDSVKLIKTIKQIGCPLSSSIACILTKVTGKPIVILNENCDQSKTIIEYQVFG